MATMWREEDEEFKVESLKPGFRPKPRFSYNEVKLLLEAVKRNRYILLKKFNQGVSAETKKQTWAEITDQINGLGENHRQVRQIMKKWADLKCDGKRRIAALRGPNGTNLKKKKLGNVEKMVHRILMMSPQGDGDSDLDLDQDFARPYRKGPTPTSNPYSYLSMMDGSQPAPGGRFEVSPTSSPEKEHGEPLHSSSDFDQADDGEPSMDFDEGDSMFSFPPGLGPRSSSALDPLLDDILPRPRPVFTYSRSGPTPTPTQTSTPTPTQNHKPPAGPSSSLSFPFLSDSDAAAPPDPGSSSSSSSAPAPAVANGTGSQREPKPKPGPVAAPAPVPVPPGPLGVAQLAAQSLQQQRAGRMLLTSVSRSLEVLAQSIQLLVESQQEFVQESLLLQRETVEILRDFSNTALSMLRDKKDR
ncbi:myb-related transcription factor, partner of profilin isoform X1 [Cololabis saira]|uniref:myb-related transcription factor, partner of profilin isoform X1 n=1 Tax=Cololabis saira TaxID=129043 RepID=UPI002AD23EAB|nr:myb-related transcription factor, partner of profilin isoform X1 [Cololabis saira]